MEICKYITIGFIIDMNLPLTINHSIYISTSPGTQIYVHASYFDFVLYTYYQDSYFRNETEIICMYTYIRRIIYKRTWRWFSTQIAVINEINDFLSRFGISKPAAKREYFSILTVKCV